eukprot:12409888-Karenia_brevis.AAC.1
MEEKSKAHVLNGVARKQLQDLMTPPGRSKTKALMDTAIKSRGRSRRIQWTQDTESQRRNSER